MFTVLFVACELAILYFVYWSVWLKKPEVYRVKNDVWGNYSGAHLKTSESMCLAFSDQYPSGLKTEKIVAKN
jgi:hypothetical protein